MIGKDGLLRAEPSDECFGAGDTVQLKRNEELYGKQDGSVAEQRAQSCEFNTRSWRQLACREG